MIQIANKSRTSKHNWEGLVELIDKVKPLFLKNLKNTISFFTFLYFSLNGCTIDSDNDKIEAKHFNKELKLSFYSMK